MNTTIVLKAQAEARRKDLEDQLNNSKYGVAYAENKDCRDCKTCKFHNRMLNTDPCNECINECLENQKRYTKWEPNISNNLM